MKRLFLALPVVLSLGACADYQANLATLTGDVVATNQAIAQVSATVAQNCNDLQATAQNIALLTSAFTSNSKANGALAAANAVLSTWCTSPPTDIASAVKVTAAEVVAAKAAFQAAQSGT